MHTVAAAAAGADGTQAAAPRMPSQPPAPPLSPHRWAQRCVHARGCSRPGFAIALEGHARLPLPAPVLFELLTHPDNAAILRSLDRCTFRRVLSDDGEGRLTAAVEQETTCHFLFYTGKVRTPLLVEHDAAAGAMTYRVPRKAECCLFDGQSGMCGHLAALEGSWRVEADGPCGSVLHFAQAVSPRGLPPLLGGAVRSFALAQVRSTCEDLYAEALRIQAGRPTLPPSSCAAAACSGQPSTGSGSKLLMGASRDPTSVLDRTYASSHGSEDGSTSGSRPRSSLDSDSCDDSASSSPFATAASSGSSAGSSGRSGRTGTAAAAVVASSAAGPASFPLPLHRLLSAASMLSGASGCLDGCWPALAASPASAPRAADSFGQAEGPVTSGISLAEHSALPASSHHLLAGRPSWLVVAATAVLALLVTLLRSLEAAVLAELRAAEAWAARLAAAAQQQ